VGGEEKEPVMTPAHGCGDVLLRPALNVLVLRHGGGWVRVGWSEVEKLKSHKKLPQLFQRR
jgi:hypothetical protein